MGYYLDASQNQHGFVLSGGHYTTFDAPNSYSTLPSGINDRGQIVGYYYAADANGGIHGFVLSGGHYSTLDDPNAAGLNVPTGINDSGQVVGYYSDPGGTVYGFIATADGACDGGRRL